MTIEPDEWVYGDYTPNPRSRDLIGLKADWILTQLPSAQNPVVLDYGTGEGKYLHLIRSVRPHAKLVGVDIRTPKTLPDFEFHHLPKDAKLPFSNNAFDIAVSCDVLEHVVDVSASLGEIHRVLRPGGLFIGFVPLEGGLGPHAFFRLFNSNLYFDTKDHRQAYRRGEMVQLMESKFRVVTLAYSYHLLGGSLDAAFFASFKLPLIGRRMEAFWRGQENSFYRASSANKEISLVGRITRLANRIAYWESRILHRVPLGASGLHFCLEK